MNLNEILKGLDEEAYGVLSRMYQSVFDQGKGHSTMSPETAKHLESLTSKMDEGFKDLGRRVDEGFITNSNEHLDIKENGIKPLELWRAKVEGAVMGAGKSVSVAWVIVVLVGGWIISPILSTYFSNQTIKKMEVNNERLSDRVSLNAK